MNAQELTEESLKQHAINKDLTSRVEDLESEVLMLRTKLDDALVDLKMLTRRLNKN